MIHAYSSWTADMFYLFILKPTLAMKTRLVIKTWYSNIQLSDLDFSKVGNKKLFFDRLIEETLDKYSRSGKRDRFALRLIHPGFGNYFMCLRTRIDGSSIMSILRDHPTCIDDYLVIEFHLFPVIPEWTVFSYCQSRWPAIGRIAYG